MIGLIETGTGFWNPLMLAAAAVVVAVIVYILRATGTDKYKKGTQQEMPFMSGNHVPEAHVKASNIYWGFLKALNSYYIWAKRMHSGIVNDYVYMFVLVVVVLLAAVAGVAFL